MLFGRSIFLKVLFAVLFIGQFADVGAQGNRAARIVAEKASLRETPSFEGLAEGEISQNTFVKVLDEKLPWYVVRVGDRVGWMHGATLEFVGPAEVPDRPSEPAQLMTLPEQQPDTRPSHQTEPRRTQTGVASGGYIRGPRGGCYYISASGRKVYVDRSLCN